MRHRRFTGSPSEPLALFFLLCSPLPAAGANIAWKAPANGSWTVSTNWMPAQVPGPGDVAIFAVLGTYDVSLDSNRAVGAINLGSTGSPRLHVNNVTLTLTTGIAVGSSSILELNSGTLSGGTVSLDGTLTSTGYSTVNASLTTATSSTIEVGAGSLTVADGFTNRGLLSFPATGIRALYVTNGTLANASTGTISCATTGTLDAELNNQGSISVIGAQGYLTLNKSIATHANSGSISVSGGGTVILDLHDDAFTTSGSFSMGAGSMVRVSEGTFQQTGGTISGDGSLEVVATTSATFASNPTIATLYLAGDGIVFPSPLVNGTAQKVILGFQGDVTVPQLTNQAGYLLDVREGFGALHVGMFTNLGTLSVPRYLLLDGNLNLGPLSAIGFGLGGLNPGTQFDRLEVTGAVQLGGGFFFFLENGFVPNPGDHFDILTSPARSGPFPTLNGWDLGNDRHLITDPAVTTSDSHPYRIRTVHQKWTPITALGTPPVPRHGHSAVYAPSTRRMIVFGGEDGAGQRLNDVWVLTHWDDPGGSLWILLNPSGTPPAPRKGHSAVYDVVNNRMIVYGGESDSSGYVSDIWVLTDADGSAGTSAWEPFPSLPGPAPRSGHAVGYNPISNRMVMSKGGLYCDGAYGDMWVLDRANGMGTTTGWSLWSISGIPPSDRRDVASAYDPNGNRLLVYGGRTPCGSVLNNAFVLLDADGAPNMAPYWSPLGVGASSVHPGVAGAPGTYDPYYDRLVVFGGLGSDGTTPSAGVFLLTDTRGPVAGWTVLPLIETGPQARAFHSMVLGSSHSMIVFGGENSGTVLSDVWVLEVEGATPTVTGIVPGEVSPEVSHRVLAFSAPPSPNPAPHGLAFSIWARESVHGRIAIYDALGRRVAALYAGPLTAGEHHFAWKGDVASGMYFVVLQSGSQKDVRRVVVAH